MQELATTATFVDYDALDSSITAVLPRSELEAARDSDEAAQLWFELGADDLDTRLVTVDLVTADIDRLLGQAPGDEVYLALDGDGLAAILGDPEVEAHGLRGALAIAVTTAAIAAPAGLAAAPQTANPAATAQKASAAATAQAATSQANPASTAQISKLVAKAKIKSAANPQRASAAAQAQVAQSLVLKANGLRLLGKGLAR